MVVQDQLLHKLLQERVYKINLQKYRQWVSKRHLSKLNNSFKEIEKLD